MNTVMSQAKRHLVAPPPDFTELVRGNEDRLMSLMAPIVQEQDAVLDMARVRRIDAAGIAALISIYGRSRSAGHTFHVCNVTPGEPGPHPGYARSGPGSLRRSMPGVPRRMNGSRFRR